MTSISIVFDDPTRFDAAVQGGMPEGMDTTIITKDNATVGGNPVAVLTFSTQLPNGEIRKAQTALTVGNLMMVLCALKGRYPQIGDFIITPQDATPRKEGDGNVH